MTPLIRAAIIIYCLTFIFLSLIILRPEPPVYPVVIINIPTVANIKEEDTPIIVSEYQYGVASYYDYDLDRKDQKCLSDDCYSKLHPTCASQYFKRGSILKVVNLDNYKSVECRVNDFGPEEWTNRQIDLSSYAFSQIANKRSGVINVNITLIN